MTAPTRESWDKMSSNVQFATLCLMEKAAQKGHSEGLRMGKSNMDMLAALKGLLMGIGMASIDQVLLLPNAPEIVKAQAVIAKEEGGK